MTVSTKSTESHHQGTGMVIHYVIIVLIIINIAISLFAIKNNDVRSVINDIEAMKVGGPENYEKLQKIMQSDAYKNNYAQNLDAMIMQMESTGQEEANVIPTATTGSTTQSGTTQEVVIPTTTADEHTNEKTM